MGRTRRRRDVDRLSSLPEDVVSQILSLMPTKFALRTSALSKRWRYTWTLVTNLDFDFDFGYILDDRMVKIVDGVLELCKTSQLKLFRAHVTHSPVATATTTKWINEAVRLNVCELDIKNSLIDLPLTLFTCATLTKLSVACFSIIYVPFDVKLDALKTLHIRELHKKYVSDVLRLIHACPVLESLSLIISSRGCYNLDKCDDIQHYNLNIPSLKRLEVITTSCCLCNIVLNLPNLEYLSVGGVMYALYVIEDLSSLVDATISFDSIVSNHLMAELLKGISGVNSLSWSKSALDVFLDSPLPKFPNLKLLDFKGSLCSRWLQVIQILERFSELEHLCIHQVPKESCWIEPQSVPSCMVSNLTTMKITTCKGRKCDIQFIEYVLGNAEVLKTLTITCESVRKKDEMWWSAQLLRIPRASRSCDIHFVGKWLNFTHN